jgi:NAD(P) transhydrogenase subunit beta
MLLQAFSLSGVSLPLLLSVESGISKHDIIYYVCAGILTLLVLVGIAMMSKVEKAVAGNRLGAVSMLLAILLTLWYFDIFSAVECWIAMLVGTVIGIVISIKVKMIEMPQMVGLLNGFGGAASMLSGILTLIASSPQTDLFSLVTAGLAIFVGSLTFTGSVVAAGKLAKWLPQKPVILKGHQSWTILTLLLSLATVILLALPNVLASTPLKALFIILCAILSGLFGVIFSIRVGGADMPITISLLNSLSGVAGSIAGMAISDPLLVAVGAIVGASGLLLTQIMCRAMNRRLGDILLGKTSTPAIKADAKKDSSKEDDKADAATDEALTDSAPEKVLTPVEQSGRLLADAKKIIIVPGYGMALSQAQSSVKQLTSELEQAGRNVEFAIHPVAGRMPGHMNVLLAEVDIPYDKLHEMDDINEDFKDADVAFVIGANDVVNPAANTAEGTPIYGMPILNVADAKNVIICNFDTQPGYAGVDNPLYDEEENTHAVLVLGDAKDSLREISEAYREACKGLEDTYRAGDTAVEDAPEKMLTPVEQSGRLLANAKKIIIVPGYGMALSQAQSSVKQLTSELEQAGRNVEIAIHPVAGRMPGHMNVLLAEVDIPYDKLHEMDDINDDFKDADVALVIGANDVVNPAANTAEGTPIYGMPILNVADAKNIIICNFDTQPGYAGVDNPLYDEEENTHAVLVLGDAKDSLRSIAEAYREACQDN